MRIGRSLDPREGYDTQEREDASGGRSRGKLIWWMSRLSPMGSTGRYWTSSLGPLSARHDNIGHMTTRSFTMTPVGEFSLAESALFGFGQRMRHADVDAPGLQFDGVMRLALCLDGYRDQVGVELRQNEQGV